MSVEHPDYSPTLVDYPKGPGPWPVMFVAHGAGGSAREVLDYFKRLLADRYVIVAVAGTPLSRAEPQGGHYYKNHLELEKEVLSVAKRLTNESQLGPAALSKPPWIYAGYSQGATMGALFLINHAQWFDRLILIEGGIEGWNLARSRRYKEGGGLRLLWLCGTPGCATGATKARDVALQVGLEAQAETLVGAGHVYWGPVGKQLAALLPWVVSPRQ